jgi:hypothetical protein
MQSYLEPTEPWSPSSIQAGATQPLNAIPSGKMSYFESTLAKNCKDVSVYQAGFIDIDKAPVAINQNALAAKSVRGQSQKLECSIHSGSLNEIDVATEGNDLAIINNDLYDTHDYSVFYDDGIIKLAVFLNAEGDIPPEDTLIGISGEKTLIMKDGEKVSVFYYDGEVIPAKDPRLVSFYRKFAKNPNPWPSNDDIKKEFFSDLSNLQEPEKSTVAKIQRLLNAVTAR